MAVLKYSNLKFTEQDAKIRVLFMDFYYFYLDKKELSKLGKFTVKRNSIEFAGEKREENLKQKFSFILSNGFDNMKSTINGKPVLYVHRNSGIPLIGSNNFGIVDRGTSTLELKPITTCNIDCIFCSVDHTKRDSDIIVESDYLLEELQKVIDIKRNKVNIHLGSQGDVSLYSDLEYIVKEIRKNRKVNAISMVTNGILITKKRADALIDAGMSHFHISLHSTHQDMAEKLANGPYPVKKVMEVCKHIAKEKRASLLLVPVWVPGINDTDIEDVIAFGKKIGAKVGIQNFLEYSFGKRPANSLPMKVFFQRLKTLEEKYNMDLTGLEGDLLIKADERLQKPFRKGDIIDVELKARDRMRNTMIGVSKDRAISVINCTKERGMIRAKLIRDKDNIFIATPILR